MDGFHILFSTLLWSKMLFWYVEELVVLGFGFMWWDEIFGGSLTSFLSVLWRVQASICQNQCIQIDLWRSLKLWEGVELESFWTFFAFWLLANAVTGSFPCWHFDLLGAVLNRSSKNMWGVLGAKEMGVEHISYAMFFCWKLTWEWYRLCAECPALWWTNLAM